MAAARSKKKGKGAPLNEQMTECLEILKFLQTRPDAEPFLHPVDWELYGLTDYPQVISHPMDLDTIDTKLHDGKYKDTTSFANDVRLVWENCMKYNMPDSSLHMTAEKMAKLFEKRFQKIRAPSSAAGSTKKIKSEDGASSSNHKFAITERSERIKLASLITKLSPEHLGALVEMISNQCPSALDEDQSDEIEIEMANLDADTLNNLLLFCQQSIKEDPSASSNAHSEGAVKKQKIR